MRRLVLLLALLLLPAPAFAVTLFTDDFESYADATNLNGLNGGSGWTSAWSESAAGKFKTNSVTVHGGSRSVKYTADASEPNATRSFTGVTSGTFSYYEYKTSAAADTCEIFMKEGASIRFAVRFWFDTTIRNNSGATTFGNYAANTWTKITIDFDNSTDQFRVAIDAGAYSAWTNYDSTATNIDSFDLQKEANGNTASCFWDDISPVSAAAFVPVPIPIITSD